MASLNFVLLVVTTLTVALINATPNEKNFFCDVPNVNCQWKGAWGFTKPIRGSLAIDRPPSIPESNQVIFLRRRNATLTSPQMEASFAGCFMFEYFIGASRSNSLSLSLNSSNQSTLLWARYARDMRQGRDDNWHVGQVQINAREKFNLEFDGHASEETYVTLANFRWVHGEDACPIKDKAECDFEAGHFCGWHTERPTSKSSNAAIPIGEAGKFGYFDVTSGSERGKVAYLELESTDSSARILSPSFAKETPVQCFSFSMLRGLSWDVSVKQVQFLPSQDSKVVWKSNYLLETNPGFEWVRVRIPVNKSQDLSRMVIEMTRTVNVSSRIMFDDLKLDPQPCSPSVDCKFGDNICGWIQQSDPPNKDKKNHWSIGTGRVQNIVGISYSDAPTHFEKFLYTDFTTNNEEKEMILQSDKLEYDGDACAHLQFAVDVFGEQARFELQTQSPLTGIVWKYDPKIYPLGQVHNIQVDIPKNIFPNSHRNFRLLAAKGLSTNSNTRISVQEIKVTEGVCGTPKTTAPVTLAPTTTPKPFIRSELDKIKLSIINEMLRTTRNEVEKAFNLITIKEDPVYVSIEKLLHEIDAASQEVTRNLA